LPFESLGDIHAITIALARDASIREFDLLWSDQAALSPSDSRRNRRRVTYFDTGPGTNVLIRGEDLSGTEELDLAAGAKPPRHFFLTVAAGREPPFVGFRIAAKTAVLAGQPYGIIRTTMAGLTRDALFVRAPGEIRYRDKTSSPARLHFGVRASAPGPKVRCRVTVGEGGASEKLWEEEIGHSTGWREVAVELPQSAGERTLRLEALSDLPGSVVLWGNPLLAPVVRHERPNVVLFLADALRPDRLSLYGYDKPTSPFLEGLGKHGVVFHNCYSTATWTKPALASLLTSLHPQTHGVGLWSNTDALPEGAVTLADVLRGNGYLTAHFSLNPLGAMLSNLDQGFDAMYSAGYFEPRAGAGKIYSDALVSEALKWIRTHQGAPFFVFIHGMDTHGPYPERRPANGTLDAYDAEVLFADRQIARLHRGLVEQGLAKDTLFVVTSDHGEALGEHGRSGHGLSVYNEEARVPLILSHPGGLRARVVEEPASLVDVMPTILEHLGIDGKGAEMQGAPVELDAARGTGHKVFVSRFVFPGTAETGQPSAERHAVADGDWKLILGVDPDDASEAELYHLGSDPAEKINVAVREPEQVDRLRRALREHLDDQVRARELFVQRHDQAGATTKLAAEDGTGGVPLDVLERLKSLGYIR
jgi:arylsulfatase A-like enzyme